MARTRMSWDFVEGYPIFVYTTFLDHFAFHVKLVKGTYGNQNDDSVNTGPSGKAWKSYKEVGLASKDEVVTRALRNARNWLKGEAVHDQNKHKEDCPSSTQKEVSKEVAPKVIADVSDPEAPPWD